MLSGISLGYPSKMYLHRYNPTYLLILYISKKYIQNRRPHAARGFLSTTSAPSVLGLRPLERSCSSREGAPTVVFRFLRFVRVLSQRPSATHQQGWTGPPQGEAVMDVSLRSLTTCGYVSEATSFAMRHCTIVVTPLLPMSPEPDSFRSCEFIIDQMHQALGTRRNRLAGGG